MVFCNICGCKDFNEIGIREFENIKTKNNIMKFKVRLVCCKTCGLVFQNPLQKEKKLERYYSAMYREEGYRPQFEIENQFKIRIQFLKKFLEKNNSKKLLEIGCADGTTLKILRNQGYVVSGIEPSKSNAKICAKKNLNVFNGRYTNFRTKIKFDLICSYYVMEHLTSPADFLKFCNRLLKPNGIICMEIPDIYCYKLEKTSPDLLFFFEHQFHFSKDILIFLLNLCGFKLLEFLPKTSHPFGMHFAAKKISKPIKKENLEFQKNIFKKTMNTIYSYEKFSENKILKSIQKFQKILSDLKNKNSVVLMPAGSYIKSLLDSNPNNLESIKFVCDNNNEKWNSTINGISIVNPNKINPKTDIIIIGSTFHKELRKQMLKLGIPKNNIVIL